MTVPRPFSVQPSKGHLSLLRNSPSGDGRQQFTFTFYPPGWANPDAPASPCMPYAPAPIHPSRPPLGSLQCAPIFLALGPKTGHSIIPGTASSKATSHRPQAGGHTLANTAQHATSLHHCKSTLLTLIQCCFLSTICFYSYNFYKVRRKRVM